MNKTLAIIYARVSSSGNLEYRQNTDRQVQDLKEYAGYKGYDLVEVFNEHISGAKKNSDRPVLVEAIEKCKELTEIGENKVILLCSELSRLGRNAFEVLDTIIDGTPITDDRIPLYEEMAADNGRDPRLNNNVNHIGLTYKSISGETYAKWMPCQLTYSGYNLTKWNIEEEQQFQVAKCGNSIPIFRYAEVLLNYAEAKAELGQMDDAVWNESVGLVRKRAGLTYTGRPKAVDKMLYDYYAEPYDFEEQGLQGNRANDLKAHLTADLLEIRRERVTELGYEGLRGDDLHRWHCLSLITEKNTHGRGNRGIWVTKEDYKKGFLFNPVFAANAQGNGKYNYDPSSGAYSEATDGKGGYDLIHGLVTFGSKASETSFGIANSGADQSFSLSEGDHGYLIFHYALEFAQKKYLYPVNSNSVLLLNPNITQNWGWE